MRAMRRLALLLLVVAVAAITVRRRRPAAVGAPPTWPPLDVHIAERNTLLDGPAVGDVAAVGDVPAVDAPTWAAPIDGACPEGFPLKANASSGIFHVPGGRSYARTRPERCYATPEDAEADGFRRAKL